MTTVNSIVDYSRTHPFRSVFFCFSVHTQHSTHDTTYTHKTTPLSLGRAKSRETRVFPRIGVIINEVIRYCVGGLAIDENSAVLGSDSCWIARFSAVWRELRVPSTCWATGQNQEKLSWRLVAISTCKSSFGVFLLIFPMDSWS